MTELAAEPVAAATSSLSLPRAAVSAPRLFAALSDGTRGQRCVVGESRKQKTTLYYETCGTGSQRVLFIMGLGTGLNGWMVQRAFFMEEPQASKYTCIFFDNRGVGRSTSPEGCWALSRYTTSDMAIDALELVNHVWGADSQFHVVGVSMGGMISQELALRCLPRLLSLTLGVTHSGAVPHSRASWTGASAMFGVITAGSNAETKADRVIDMLYSEAWQRANPERLSATRDLLIHRIQTDTQPTGFFGQLMAVATHYVSEQRLTELRDSGVPILLISGTEDKLVHHSNTEHLKTLLHPQEYVIVDGAGHSIQHECEEHLHPALLRILDAGAARAASLSGAALPASAAAALPASAAAAAPEASPALVAAPAAAPAQVAPADEAVAAAVAVAPETVALESELADETAQ